MIQWKSDGNVPKKRENNVPTYLYVTEDGETAERVCPMGEAPGFVRISGKIARRDYSAEHANIPSASGWPMEPCVASGVGAEQAGELRKFFKDHGCPTEVTADGDPVYQSKVHRERALKLRKMHDRN